MTSVIGSLSIFVCPQPRELFLLRWSPATSISSFAFISQVSLLKHKLVCTSEFTQTYGSLHKWVYTSEFARAGAKPWTLRFLCKHTLQTEQLAGLLFDTIYMRSFFDWYAIHRISFTLYTWDFNNLLSIDVVSIQVLSSKFSFYSLDRGPCLPTLSLWLLFVYVEASVRLRGIKSIPFHLDLCRPFAAHW